MYVYICYTRKDEFKILEMEKRDNMWLQGIATILPRVQAEFSLSETLSGLLITSTYVGMMVGAAFWGALSDRIGRKPAFSWTLSLTGLFGTLAAFSPNFGVLCTLFFLMGSGVGGNLPTDSALFLEFIPMEHQGLLTLLSLFWPVGSVIAALLSWALIPPHSCSPDWTSCPSQFNRGWRYVIFCLGLLTLLMLVSRKFIIFDLLESPKFLISRGEIEQAVTTLKVLAQQNKKRVHLDVKEFEQVFENDDVFWLPQQDKRSKDWERLSQLFSKNLWLTTALIWMIWPLTSFGYTLFNGFLPKFLESQPNHAISTTEVYWRYLVISFFGIPGSILGTFFFF